MADSAAGATSILVSSQHKRKALRPRSDSALIAEMFPGSFGGLSSGRFRGGKGGANAPPFGGYVFLRT